MRQFSCVALVDPRGWLLMQERDEHAPVEPDRWCFPGGGLEPGETPEQAAYRELAEETAIYLDTGLTPVTTWTLTSPVDGQEAHGHLFAAATDRTDADVVCGEGRQMVFVAPQAARGLDLMTSLPELLDDFLGSDLYHQLRSVSR